MLKWIVVALLVGAVAAGAGLVWAKSYQPLEATAYYSPGYGVSKTPRMDDDGLLSLVARKSPAHFAELRFVVQNTGRWPITIDRAVPSYPCTTGPCFALVGLREPPPERGAGYALSTRPLRPLRVPAGGKAELWVRYRGDCGIVGRETMSSRGLALVYHYLWFKRTQIVGWPFGITYSC
jgi:hypothetical protein